MSDDEQVRRAEGQINLLLEEYRSLRSEITTRLGARMTLLGFLTASAALLVGAQSGSTWVYILVVGLIATGAAVWFRSGQLLGMLSDRLATLEDSLNARAGEAFRLPQDRPLLAWEKQMRDRRHRLLRDLMS